MGYNKFHTVVLILFFFLLLSTLLFSQLVSFTEDFSTDPALRGWSYSGINPGKSPHTPPLFVWNSTENRLDVTYNSNLANSMFFKPLDVAVDECSIFKFSFKLFLTNIQAETDGFCQFTFGLRNTTRDDFDRFGKDFFNPNDPYSCFDIVEWGYVPNPQSPGLFYFDPFVFPTICTSESDNFRNNWSPATVTQLQTDVLYEITQTYEPAERKLYMEMTADGVPITNADVTTPVSLYEGDVFYCNAIAVSNYYNRFDWNLTPDTIVHGYIDDISFEYYGLASAENWNLFN